MNGVIGMTELLLDTDLNAVQRDYCQTARDSGKALLTVINDILDFSKIEAGKIELERIDIDIRETIHDVCRLLAVQAHARELKIVVTVDPDIPLSVKGDANRFRQILLNLGGNAVKFTAQGQVCIDAKLVENGLDGSLVRCEIRDTGIGIHADRLATLFRPFTQADPSTTRRFGGTGLGLSIVKHLVTLMGGETGAASTEGAGSTFWFTVRFGVGSGALQPSTIHPISDSELHARRYHVLLVEDNLVNQKVACRTLERIGYRVDIAGDGKAAVEAWVQGNYDLILMDCQMPVMDGYEATRAIRARESAERRRHVPIVALTAHAMKGADAACAAAGMDGYLTKPIDRALLQGCLEKYLAHADATDEDNAPEVNKYAGRGSV
jgi:CheY-like chemotaxis protein